MVVIKALLMRVLEDRFIKFPGEFQNQLGGSHGCKLLILKNQMQFCFLSHPSGFEGQAAYAWRSAQPLIETTKSRKINNLLCIDKKSEAGSNKTTSSNSK